ncbi:SDR family oxidoreductase [Arenibacter nanhaiticus]|nr:SDR family oxidoreductase [Arenibacter nanhaiticus]
MSDGGSVIITSSVAGLKGFEGLGAYVAIDF